MHIHVQDIIQSNIAASAHKGISLQQALRSAIAERNGEAIRIDFSDVRHITVPFLHNAVAPILHERLIQPEQLVVESLSAVDTILYNTVVEQASLPPAERERLMRIVELTLEGYA